MKGDILLKTLQILKDQSMNQVDFIEAVLESGYGASMNKIEYKYQKNRRERSVEKIKNDFTEERKKKLRVFISKMKHDGLIDKVKTNLSISNKGKIKLSQLMNKLPGRNYEKEVENGLVIVSFDIPEKLRRKRNWIREVIRNLGFEMVHQSVWAGNIKIPQNFILDLERLNILEYVQIFEVGKKGTLRKLE